MPDQMAATPQIFPANTDATKTAKSAGMTCHVRHLIGFFLLAPLCALSSNPRRAR